MRQFVRSLGLAVLVALAGCQSLGTGGGSRPVAVDAGSAAAMISAFRVRQGLGPVAVSSSLNAIARDQAAAMAGRDRMSHDVAGSLAKRIERGGYVAFTAAENLAAGYDDLGKVMADWERSASHRENLLKDAVTEIGIAAAATDGDRGRTYWALVLANPR